MQLAHHLPLRFDRPTRTRARRARQPAEQMSQACAATHDAARAGGPEDQALYSCGCGYAFTAQVTTSVGCPHCGTQQAW